MNHVFAFILTFILIVFTGRSLYDSTKIVLVHVHFPIIKRFYKYSFGPRAFSNNPFLSGHLLLDKTILPSSLGKTKVLITCTIVSVIVAIVILVQISLVTIMNMTTHYRKKCKSCNWKTSSLQQKLTIKTSRLGDRYQNIA